MSNSKDRETEKANNRKPLMALHIVLKSGAEIVVDVIEYVVTTRGDEVTAITWKTPGPRHPGLRRWFRPRRRLRHLRDVTLSEIAAIWAER